MSNHSEQRLHEAIVLAQQTALQLAHLQSEKFHEEIKSTWDSVQRLQDAQIEKFLEAIKALQQDMTKTLDSDAIKSVWESVSQHYMLEKEGLDKLMKDSREYAKAARHAKESAIRTVEFLKALAEQQNMD